MIDGSIAGEALPAGVVAVGSGLLFVGFGAWSLRGGDVDEVSDPHWCRGALATIAALAVSFFVSELGDKTQVAAISLASMERAGTLGVWGGATLGMVAGDAIAIAAGRQLRSRISARALRRIAACTFIAFGVVTLALAAIEGTGT
ncbi:MAG: UPF0016 domain-containing protein [Dehalococcoidia bacterium]|nr:UPF0016 domain-containing protein [Dehalococcoidia bacterium]